jgi:hypothetical protein
VITGDVRRREDLNIQDGYLDKEGCYTICSYFDPDTLCSNIKVQDSIASGCVYTGFTSPGHECGAEETQDNFRGNVAHSSENYGAIIFNDRTQPSQETCYGGSHFSAYKTNNAGVVSHEAVKEVRFSNMLMVDIKKGVTMHASGKTNPSKTVFKDSVLYGEQDELADDCPPPFNC